MIFVPVMLWWKQERNVYTIMLELIIDITNLKPRCLIWRIINETQFFKQPVGHLIVDLYVAVHWIALSTYFFDHWTNQDFGIAFPSVLRQSVQQPHGTVIVHQNPGHWLALLVCDAARREVLDQVIDVAVACRVPAELPCVVYQVSMGWTKRWYLHFILAEREEYTAKNCVWPIFLSKYNDSQLETRTVNVYCIYALIFWPYLSIFDVGRWVLSGKCMRCTNTFSWMLTLFLEHTSFNMGL